MATRNSSKIDFTPTNGITWEQARDLFAKVQYDRDGKPINGTSARIFKNVKDESFTIKHRRRRNYRAQDIDLFTLYKDGRIVMHHVGQTLDDVRRGYGFRHNVDEAMWNRLRELLPGVVAHTKQRWASVPYLVNPDSGSKPKPKAVPDVIKPYFAAPDDKHRDKYDAQVAKYGSLEKWHEAWDQRVKIEKENSEAEHKWQQQHLVPCFDGAVVSRDGMVTKTSLQKFQREVKKIKVAREKELAERKEREEKARKERAAREAKIEADRKAQREKALKRIPEAGRKALENHVGKGKKQHRMHNANDIPDAVMNYIIDRKLTVNSDGTVRMIKAVKQHTLASSYGTVYKVGTVVEAPDYRCTESCGAGLHFSPTFNEARAYCRGGYNENCRGDYNEKVISVICDVDLATMVIVGNDKVKSKSCIVVAVGDENGTPEMQGLKEHTHREKQLRTEADAHEQKAKEKRAEADKLAKENKVTADKLRKLKRNERDRIRRLKASLAKQSAK